MKYVLYILLISLCSCAAMNPTGTVTETVKTEGLRYKIAPKPKIIRSQKNDLTFETQLFFQQLDYILNSEYASYGLELNNKQFYVMKPVPIGGAVGRISGVMKFTNNSDRIIRSKEHIIIIKLNGQEVRINTLFSHGTSKAFEIYPNDWIAVLFVTTDMVDFTALPKTNKVSVSIINLPTKTDLAGNVTRVSNFSSDHYFTIASSKETEHVNYRKVYMSSYDAFDVQNQVAYRKLNTDNSIEYEKRSVLSEFQEIINQYSYFGLGQERTDFKLNDLFLPIDGQMTERHRWNVIPLK